MTNDAMAIELTNANGMGLTNAKLDKAVFQIHQAALNVQTQTFKVAFIVARIQNEQLWRDDFESFEEFGLKVLGKKRASLFNLAKVGNGWVDFRGHTIFYNGELDYSPSKLFAIMRLKAPKGQKAQDLALALHNTGAINYAMSVDELKEVIDAESAKYAPKRKTAKGKDEKQAPKGNAKAIVTDVATVRHTLEFLESGNGAKMLAFEDATVKLTDEQYVQVLAQIAQIMSEYESVATANVEIEES